ncbi:multicopper oxidase domain-containing protein [Microterricola viridarii]|uniref:Multicopper oxidase with three cupredoxin domains (Includes cell division protein FtsP and spore coat protein CotA) n=1 Tax=Microterricola viridarii TaxID=412690 RepID=A0A1H1XFN3_9MICO|nr:multicopper oxidase domain-containing protein [Microterricola viridarii]SDT07579.1 Multicopper oxidase with three cupredoxin domains (includes cell division protein FtsP and spore coat protein CotA) [Microterricola viridarii]
MSTVTLLVLDLALTIVGAGSWLAALSFAAGTIAPKRARLALLFSGLATLALLARVPLVLALSGSGWWFVQEKLTFSLPLQALATAAALALAVPALLQAARRAAPAPDAAADGEREGAAPSTQRLPARAPTALLGAALACAAGLLASTLIGYPLDLGAAAVLAVLVLLGTGVGYAVFARAGRRMLVGFAGLGALVLVAAVAFSWMTSMVPPDFAEAQPGGGHASAHGLAAAGPTSSAGPASTAGTPDELGVDSLRTPADVAGPRKEFTLRAATETLTLASGDEVESWNYGALPGPELRVQQGDVVEVHLENVDVEAGVTIHWHGYDVPNGEDGVAGVTQDSVLPGESFDYRFVAEQAGTYWYHTHQNASRGVQRGLFGVLIVEPAGGIPERHDLVVPLHTIGDSVLLGTSDRPSGIGVPTGESVRLRLVNTDMLPTSFHLAGTPFTVVAVDGQDVASPTPVDGRALRLPAGGRVDLAFTMPDERVALTTDATASAWLALTPGQAASGPASGPASERPPDRSAEPELDLLAYGGGPAATLPAGPLVRAEMVLDRNPRFLQGVPVNGYTVNGAVYPQIPSITVDGGDVVELTVANRGWETHPMHVHGHHVLVLSRNGEPATGAPLLLDTFDVRPGEVWVVALVADNLGIWMDHCHNLDHAAEGMMMALHYRGVITPYEHGGAHGNRSE